MNDYKGYYYTYSPDLEEWLIYNSTTDDLVGGGVDEQDCKDYIDIMVAQGVDHESLIDWSKA